MTEHDVSVKAIRRATRRGPRAIRDVPGDAVAQGWASTAVAFAVQFAESTHVAHRQIATLREPTPTSA